MISPEDKADKEHTFINIHATNPKIKYKTFVNIGDDCIFMAQKTPDFFLIKDPEAREKVIYEHQEDLKNDPMDEQKKAYRQAADLIQREDETLLKPILRKLLESQRNKAKILKILEEIIQKENKRFGHYKASEKKFRLSKYNISDLKHMLIEVQEDIISEKNHVKAKEKITESSYRCFKECLCPVCFIFACPFHTPIERQDGNDDGQELEEIPYNPFILEESNKRIRIYADRRLTYEEEILLQENKTFFNISERLKMQKREENSYNFKCVNPKNWAFSQGSRFVKVIFTAEERTDIDRLSIGMHSLKSCQINYLLGLDKCAQINNYLIANDKNIKVRREKEEQRVNIEDYLDKCAYQIQIAQAPSQKGRARSSRRKRQKRQSKELVDDTMKAECINPCHHDGSCSKENNCEWMENNRYCEKYCHCSSYCNKRFPGCTCLPGSCGPSSCICYKSNREWDPEICKSCVCDIQSSLLLLNGKGLPPLSNLCRNNDMITRRERKLFVGKSKICPGLGLFAGEVIEPQEYICLYSGEILTDRDSEDRGVIQDAIEETYLFTLNSKYAVDASKVGNIMRYANHSVGAYINANPKVITYVNGDQKVGLYSTRKIEIGQEILFDYNFKKEFKWIEEYKKKFIVNS